MATISEIAERARSTRQMAIGAALGLGYVPDTVGNALVLKDAEADRVVETISWFAAKRRRPHRNRRARVPA